MIRAVLFVILNFLPGTAIAQEIKPTHILLTLREVRKNGLEGFEATESPAMIATKDVKRVRGTITCIVINENPTCETFTEHKNFAVVETESRKYHISKGALSGTDIYHDQIGKTIVWVLKEEGNRRGTWSITLLSVDRDVRVYREKLTLRSKVVERKTTFDTLGLRSSSGKMGDMKFKLERLMEPI